MEQQTLRKKVRKQGNHSQSSSSNNSFHQSRNLYALIGEENMSFMPYKSKFEINSIGSGKSRHSRDSDLLNRLGKEPSKGSSKSLNRHISQTQIHHKSLMSSNSNSLLSDHSGKLIGQERQVQQIKQAPKIHNCVCFVAGQCLKYNCNCFLSPFPCAPECCPICITLKATLPLKIANICSCKKTKCLKLYCECLSKGEYCSIMCRCQLCQNHQHSMSRKLVQNCFVMPKGCSCQKSHCRKKYCQCFSQGLKCTERCSCCQCKNFIQLLKMEVQDRIQSQHKRANDAMDIQIPEMQFQPMQFFGKCKK